MALFAQLVSAMPRLSITYDETIYIGVGYSDLVTGDYRWHEVIGHGPLTNQLTAWPLLLRPDRVDVTQLSTWGTEHSLGIGREVLAALGPLQGTVFATRLPVALLTVLLAVVVIRWARQLGGRTTGLIAAALFAFEPNLIAHGMLNTDDLGVTAFGFLGTYLLSRYLGGVTRGAFIGCAVALGAAIAAKASGLFWAGAYGLIVLITVLPSLKREPGEIAQALAGWGVRLAGIYCIAILTVWICYGFELGPVQPGGLLLPAPSHWRGIPFIQSSLEEGQTTYLLGQLHQGGHWGYFPVTILLKTPLPFLAGILLVLYAVGRRRLGARWQTVPLTVTAGAYFAISMVAKLNIGHRHLLPILPYLVVLIARSVDALILPALHRSRWRRGVAVALVGWYVIGTLSSFPHYLSYFNELAGGLDGGYRYLADSSTDWGQGLIALADHLEVRAEGQGPQPVYLAAFSSVDPTWYGLDYEPLPPTEQAAVRLPSRFRPHTGTYAISVVPLQGIWLLDPDTYDWFRHREPVARIAHVFNIYEVERGVEADRRIAQCASPTPVLDTLELAEGFGQADDSGIWTSSFDCAESWLYPTDGGVLVLPDAAQHDQWMTSRLAGSTLSFAQREHWSHPAATLYRVPSTPDGARPSQVAVHLPVQGTPLGQILADIPPVTGPVATSGPLAFLGYDVQTGNDKVLLDTFWRVDATADRLLSLMAHLLNADGSAVAVADGLGVPIEHWMPGDVIVQRHRFPKPTASGNGYYLQVGAYWLDTMDRWAMQDAVGGTSDSVILPECVGQR